jgi:hypothetical protein
VTIFSRLTLKAALGLAERKDPLDDDGAAADDGLKKLVGPENISDEQVTELKKLADGTEEAFLHWMGVPNIESIPASEYGKAKGALEAKRASTKKPAARK